jgi:hypothetical protein
MVIDSGLILLLEAAHLGSDPWSESQAVLYQEALLLCKNDIPGNFIHLRNEDPAAAIILGWVIFQHTRQPRTLFIPKGFILKYGYLFKELDHGNSIRPIEGFLLVENNARNWLGMVSLVYAGESMILPHFSSLIDLLSWQFTENARILLDGGELFFRKILKYTSTCNEKLFTDIYGSCMIIRWQGTFEVNEAIPVALVADFLQDDPVVAGISTLMSDNERFQLYYAVRSLLPMLARPVRFIEVGSFAGGTFYEICKAMQRHSLPFQGVAIEPDGKACFHEVINYFKDNAVHLAMTSHEAAPLLDRLFAGSSLPELILIDGDHRYEAVLRDIQDYYRLLAPGGIIMFHDYLPPCTEMNQAFISERMAGMSLGVSDACRELLEGLHGLVPLDLPRLYPANPCQTLASQAIIPRVYSTISAYRKPTI